MFKCKIDYIVVSVTGFIVVFVVVVAVKDADVLATVYVGPHSLSKNRWSGLNIFKSRLLRFVRLLENSVFTCHNPIGIKCFTRIRLGFNDLRYHRFKHGFLDAIDPLCNYSTGIENTVHYFLHCPNFATARNTFLNEIGIVDRSIIDQDEIKIIQTFLYGNPTYSVNNNKLILDASTKYILETKRFEVPIF